MALVPAVSFQSIWKFSPQSIPGLTMWLDASDTSSITLSGTNVTQWKDKSVNGFNATQATSGNQPTYNSGTRSLSFNGTSSAMISSLTIPFQTHSIFIVFNPTTTSTNTNVLVFETTDGSSYINTPYYNSSNTPPTAAYINSLSTLKYNTNPTLVYNNTIGATSMVEVVVASGSQAVYLNGNAQTTTSSAITSGTTPTLTIGAWNSASGYTGFFQGTVNEIIIYNTTLTTQQRQQVEGYLAWKWNLQTNLPPAHPYLSSFGIMPFARTFSPTDISGCALWLDGGDANTLTLNGSNVSQWNDKSGNGYNAAQATSTNQPTYNSSGGLNFTRASNPNTSYLTTTYTGSSTETIFAAVNPGVISNVYTFTMATDTVSGNPDITISSRSAPSVSLAGMYVMLGSNLNTNSYGFVSNTIYYILSDNTTTNRMQIASLSVPGTAILSTLNHSTYNNGGTPQIAGSLYDILSSPSLTSGRSLSILGTNTCFTGNNALSLFTPPQPPTGSLLPSNTKFLLGTTYNGGATAIAYLNGSTQSGTAVANTITTGSSTRIGGNYGGTIATNSSGFGGTIYEIIIYNTLLTTQQRQQVEGYLSKKWGLTLSISAHLYSTYPPSTPTPFNPLVSTQFNSVVSTPAFWYDASKTSTGVTVLSITPNTPTSGNATVVVASSSGLGSSVTISGTGTSNYDGTYAISSLSGNTFRITSSNTNYFPNIPLTTDTKNPLYLSTFSVTSLSTFTSTAATGVGASISLSAISITGLYYGTSGSTNPAIPLGCAVSYTGNANIYYVVGYTQLTTTTATIQISGTLGGTANTGQPSGTLYTHSIAIANRTASNNLASNWVRFGSFAGGTGLSQNYAPNNIAQDDWVSGATSNITVAAVGGSVGVINLSGTAPTSSLVINYTSVTTTASGYATYNFTTVTSSNLGLGAFVSIIGGTGNSGNTGIFEVISSTATTIYVYNPAADGNSTSGTITSLGFSIYPNINGGGAYGTDLMYFHKSTYPSASITTNNGVNQFNVNSSNVTVSYPYIPANTNFAVYSSFTFNVSQNYGPSEYISVGGLQFYGDGNFTLGGGNTVNMVINTLSNITVSPSFPYAVTVPISIDPSILGLGVGSCVSFGTTTAVTIAAPGNINNLFIGSGTSVLTSTAFTVSGNSVTVPIVATTLSLNLRIGSRISFNGVTTTSGNINNGQVSTTTYTISIGTTNLLTIGTTTLTIPVTSNPSSVLGNGSWVWINGNLNFGSIVGLWQVSSVTSTSITIYANLPDAMPRYFTTAGTIYVSNPNYWTLTAVGTSTVTFNMLNNIPTNNATASVAGTLAQYPNPSCWVLTGVSNTSPYSITFNMTNNVPLNNQAFTTTTAYNQISPGGTWLSGDTFKIYSNGLYSYLYKISGNSVTNYGIRSSSATGTYAGGEFTFYPRTTVYTGVYTTVYLTNVAYYLPGTPCTTVTANGIYATYTCSDLTNSGIVVGSNVNIIGYNAGYNLSNVVVIAKTSTSITVPSALAAGTYPITLAANFLNNPTVCLVSSYFPATATSTNLLSLNDLSINGCNIIVSSQYPLSSKNGLNTINLANNNPALLMPYSTQNITTNNFSFFGVFYINANSTLQPLIQKTGAPTGSPTSYTSVNLSVTSANTITLTYQVATTTVYSITSATVTTGWHIISAVANRSTTAASSNYINIDGITGGTFTTPITTTLTNTSAWELGGYGCSANLGELIFINANTTLSQCQQIEGYLGWKWGITLPTTHPYYKFSP